MVYGDLVGGSLRYAKDGLAGRVVLWAILIVLLLPMGVSLLLNELKITNPTVSIVLGLLTLIFALFITGYTMEIWRGKVPAPDFKDWGKYFIDGIKLLVATFIYFIPSLIIVLIAGGMAVTTLISNLAFLGDPNYLMTHQEELIPLLGGFIAGVIIALIVFILLFLFATIGFVRMARMEHFGEAFNFSAILSTIRAIGWGRYILSLILLAIVAGIITLVIAILGAIPFIGWVLYIVLMPFLLFFEARYLTMVYELGEAPASEAPLVTPQSPA